MCSALPVTVQERLISNSEPATVDQIRTYIELEAPVGSASPYIYIFTRQRRMLRGDHDTHIFRHTSWDTASNV
jgi:hypothetical protein